MKRTLVIIRHAKAKDLERNEKDFDRTLTDQGKTDAVAMGVALKELKLIPDLIITSPAKRTLQTAGKIAIASGFPSDNINVDERLYHCSADVIESVISEVNNSVKVLFIIAHNPGITDFAVQLEAQCGSNFGIIHIPTCGVVAAHIESENWFDYSFAKRNIFLFKFP